MSDVRFRREDKDNITIIYLTSALDQKVSAELQEESKSWLPNPNPVFVLDFSGVLMISNQFYRIILQIKDMLKKSDKKMFSMGLNEKLIRQVRFDGMEAAFNPVESLPTATASQSAIIAANRPKPLDVAFINPFLTATMKTLEVQCQTKIKFGKPYLKKEQQEGISVASVLSLVSEGFSGSIVLCFPSNVFLKIYENMFGEKHAELTSDIGDAAGELLNIIYGQAKADLNKKGYKFPAALPTVMYGPQVNIRQTGGRAAMVIPFQMDIGQFHLEVEFEADVLSAASAS